MWPPGLAVNVRRSALPERTMHGAARVGVEPLGAAIDPNPRGADRLLPAAWTPSCLIIDRHRQGDPVALVDPHLADQPTRSDPAATPAPLRASSVVQTPSSSSTSNDSLTFPTCSLPRWHLVETVSIGKGGFALAWRLGLACSASASERRLSVRRNVNLRPSNSAQCSPVL